jgi:hypothetical protein
MKTRILFLASLLVPYVLYSQTIVTTQGRDILVNGKPYYIRGVCYNPVAIGDDRFDTMDFSHIDRDIQLMQQANINTIRTYMPILKAAILDKFASAGIKVIIGFPNYDDTFRYPDINHGTYLDYIKTYKGNNAILMWELGNEYNYHPEWFSDNINNWYTILNNAASAIHTADPNHPVSTAHGEFPASSALALCPKVDVWGMNVYRWNTPLGAITSFTDLSAKPCYLSESGTDRYNNTEGKENQQNQADAVLAIWNNIKGSFGKFSGITYFSFVDEWWKSGNVDKQDATGISLSVPNDNFANEEWWGIVDIERNTTLAYDALKSAFTGFTGIAYTQIGQKTHLFPNPAVSNTSLRLSEAINENIILNISSITGIELASETVLVSGSEIEIPLDRLKLSSGMYIISATGKSLKANNLLIVQ